MQYETIRLWGKMLGSFDYFIEDEIDRAKSDNAPSDAIYCDSYTGQWHRAGDLPINHPFRRYCESEGVKI